MKNIRPTARSIAIDMRKDALTLAWEAWVLAGRMVFSWAVRETPGS